MFCELRFHRDLIQSSFSLQLELTISHIWLLFYDLYHRAFKKRETAVVAAATRLFHEAGLTAASSTTPCPSATSCLPIYATTRSRATAAPPP